MSEHAIWKPYIWLPKLFGIPPSPPVERRLRREREILRDVRTYTGRLPAPLRDCIHYMRGLGGMSGMAGEHGKIAAAFGPMGSAVVGPTASPTHFYRMEDTNWADTGAGTQLDLSYSGHAPTANTGQIGNAAYFNSAWPDILTRADHADFEMGSGNYTGWGWVWSNSYATQYGLMGKQDGYFSDSEWFLQFTGGGVSYLALYVTSDGNAAGAANVAATTFGGVASDTWYFVAFRRNAATNIQISVNGGAWNTTNYASNIYTGTAAFYMGCRGFHGGSPLNPLNGRIDAVALFPGSAVSDADVTEGYNSGAGHEYYSGTWH